MGHVGAWGTGRRKPRQHENPQSSRACIGSTPRTFGQENIPPWRDGTVSSGSLPLAPTPHVCWRSAPKTSYPFSPIFQTPATAGPSGRVGRCIGHWIAGYPSMINAVARLLPGCVALAARAPSDRSDETIRQQLLLTA